MRPVLAGILCWLFASIAWAQATGDIEGVGFDHAYRPGCWTPMVVRLTPTTGAPFEGKIAVYQEDADHNHPIFTRPVSLRGNAEGGGEKTQRFWTYFIPQADLLSDGNDPTHVNRKLQVFLETQDNKQIARLPLVDQIVELDRAEAGRSTRLVLCVVGTSTPVFSPYGQGGGAGVIGTKEDIFPVMISAGNIRALLPESVLGYEAVDSVIWTDADPGALSAEQRTALEDFIKRGGKLVVSQTGKATTWEQVRRGFQSLLPVDVESIDKETDLKPLKRIVAARSKYLTDSKYDPQWKDVGKPPYDYAVAKAKPGAVVDEWENDDGTGWPFIVRSMYGMGTVTWVAQDLGDNNLTGRSQAEIYQGKSETFKWMYIWDRVMDWHDASQPKAIASEAQNKLFGDTRQFYHLTRSFLGGMEFPGRTLGYLSLAFLFFIVYWIVAGPGSYLYLASKKRVGASWWAFAVVAVGAAALTIIVVKVVLRGSPQIKHITFVRQTPGEPTWIQSQFGLYIPRDGGQRVELKGTIADSASYVVAYPSLVTSDEGPPPLEYEVPVFDPQAVTFPFRSTLTKMQAQWNGDMPMGVEGGGRLIAPAPGGYIEGVLTNKTGRNLRDIYIAFRTRSSDGKVQDELLYVPKWDADQIINLNKAYNSTTKSFTQTVEQGPIHSHFQDDPGSGLPYSGWELLWYSRLQNDKDFSDHPDHPANFSLLSFYNRMSPVPAMDFSNNQSQEHADLHRAALRKLDISDALAAGKLIVLAQTADPGPLPFPLQVEGDEIKGEGTTYYQFILPLDRSILNEPTTQPATEHP